MSTESVSAPVALATGADRGIGLETAWHLTGAGYRVYLTARTGERGRAAAATVGAQSLELDVTSDESVRHAAGCVEQAGGTWTYWSITPASPARCVTRAATAKAASHARDRGRPITSTGGGDHCDNWNTGS